MSECARAGCDWPIEFDGGDKCIRHAAEEWVSGNDGGGDA